MANDCWGPDIPAPGESLFQMPNIKQVAEFRHEDGRVCRRTEGRWWIMFDERDAADDRRRTVEYKHECVRSHEGDAVKVDADLSERGEFGMPGVGHSASEAIGLMDRKEQPEYVFDVTEQMRQMMKDNAGITSAKIRFRPSMGAFPPEWATRDEFGYENESDDIPHSQKVVEVLHLAIELFERKAAGYGEPDGDDLGAAGQFADMHRKFKRLRRTLWEGEPWSESGEPLEEVLLDLIGHIGKTIVFLREEEDKR